MSTNSEQFVRVVGLKSHISYNYLKQKEVKSFTKKTKDTWPTSEYWATFKSSSHGIILRQSCQPVPEKFVLGTIDTA